MPPAEAVLRLRGGTAELDQLYPWLEDAATAAGVPPKTQFGMQLALEEVVVNAATHGAREGETCHITVTFCPTEAAAVLVVEDTGVPFDPTAAPQVDPSQRILEDELGGLGLVLLRRYCQGLLYERTEDAHNRLTMSFRLGAEG
jgi:anti-sigma regulatory factor (Ser/Thr protein kinase)